MKASAVVVDRNLVSASLLSEKLTESGASIPVACSLEDALRCTSVSAVAVWSFVWPDQEGELHGLERYASRARILAVGPDCPETVQAKMLLIGVRGFVNSGGGVKTVIAAFRKVRSGERYFSEGVLSRGIDALTAAQNLPEGKSSLTAREAQIVQHVVRGASNKEIAAKLNLTESTVKSHLQRIFGKLGVSSRLALALHALRESDVAIAPSESNEGSASERADINLGERS